MPQASGARARAGVAEISVAVSALAERPVAFPRVSVSLPAGQPPAAAAAHRHRMPTPFTATRAPGETARPARPPAAHPRDPCPPPRSPARPRGPSQSPRAVGLPPSWGLTPPSRRTTAARLCSSPLTHRNALLRSELSTPFRGLPTPRALPWPPLLGPRPPWAPWLPPALPFLQAQAHQARPTQLLPPPVPPPPPPLPSGRNQPWSPLSWARAVPRSPSCCAVRSPELWGHLGPDPASRHSDPPKPLNQKVWCCGRSPPHCHRWPCRGLRRAELGSFSPKGAWRGLLPVPGRGSQAGEAGMPPPGSPPLTCLHSPWKKSLEVCVSSGSQRTW